MSQESDLNKFELSGTICEPLARNEKNGSVFYTALVRSVYYGKNKTIESFHNVEAWGDLGKKLSQFRPGQKIVVIGRMTSFRGINKTTGAPYVAYFKVVPSEIHYVETSPGYQEPPKQWGGASQSIISDDSIPF
jgi:single-stranded DNA-binding protein